jgi:hypothetical protein
MAWFSDPYVWRFIEIEIAAARGPTSHAKKVERAHEPRSPIAPGGPCTSQLHFVAASASASVR